MGGNLTFKVVFHSGEYGTHYQYDSMFSAHYDDPKHGFYIMGFFEVSL
jgi:hypothetical protein